jgi:cytochrome c oxidase assembly protein subunit 11
MKLNGDSRRLARLALLVCGGGFLFGFAMIPIYRIACVHVFGIKLANAAAEQGKAKALVEDTSRSVTVQFVANVNSRLDWDFKPEVVSVQVHPGKLTQAWFDATNHESIAIVGNAVPSVAPSSASGYFRKTECFCFTEQQLGAGESRRMPVSFYIEPELSADIRTLTLSYTFYNNEAATARLAEQNSPTAKSAP